MENLKTCSLVFILICSFSVSLASLSHYQKSEVTDACPEPGKSSWPELVGINGYTAEVIIQRENPKVIPEIVEENTTVSTDIVCDRVRVWVDKNGVVYQIPQIG